MNRDDWTGLGISLAFHALILLGFAVVSGAAPPEPLGLVEVEFGPFEMAQPATRAETQQPSPTTPRPDPQPTPPRPEPKPQQAQPVKLPDPPPASEREAVPPPSPKQATPAPERETRPERPVADPAAAEQTGGNPQGTTGSTSEAGDEGASTTRRAPYSIDGLNRTPRRAPLPQNPGGVGTVTVRVTVAPSGAVAQVLVLRRAGPALDRAVQEAVRSWSFNPLPPAAPQENQQGTITFFFSLD